MEPWTPCKLADAMDFFRPEFVANLALVGHMPTFHSKEWEWAHLIEAKRALAPSARRLVGLGCGCEPSIPVLADGAESVIATDLYGHAGAWAEAAHRPDEAFPSVTNLRSHTMDMRRIDLPPRSADFVWSLCAIEHVGDIDDVAHAVRQAGELLADDGVFVATTEFNFGAKPYRTRSTLFLDKADLEKVVCESRLHLVAPIRLSLSRHPMNAAFPVWVRRLFPFAPQVLYRHQKHPLAGTLAGVVSFVLSRHDRGVPTFDEDPNLTETVAALEEIGARRVAALASPKFWTA